jgi:hypothetical protein
MILLSEDRSTKIAQLTLPCIIIIANFKLFNEKMIREKRNQPAKALVVKPIIRQFSLDQVKTK